MTTMNTATQTKLDKIMANAKRNQREARKFDLTALTPEAEEALKSESVSLSQMELLDKLGVEYDPRPLDEGGTTSRWNAMHLIEAGLVAAQERREIARAQPATQQQILALLKFGCDAGDLENLTRGEASDLIRNFTKEIEARKAARQGK